jgi:hypothetical protein
MKISEAIRTLQAIQVEFGDIAITGGYMSDDRPLERMIVTDKEGVEIWPARGQTMAEVDGVFLQ